MAEFSSLLVSLGLLNLLLVSAGLLLSYFDWSAARKREFLYIYFSEDKPGASYFTMARRRRAQYTRLVIAFSVLFVAEFLTANMFSSQPDDVKVQTWILCWHMLGLALLGLGFLFDPESKHKIYADVAFALFLAAWSTFILLLVTGLLRGDAVETTVLVSLVSRLVLVAVFVVTALSRRHKAVPAGLLRASPTTFVIAFGLWAAGPLINVFAEGRQALVVSEATVFVSYFLLVSTVVRSTLTEYENIEGSRHRLGNERQVILSFLQRIGAAFTTSLDVDKVLRIILESALETTEAASGAIYLYNAETKTLAPRIVLNFFPPLHVDTPAALSAHRSKDLEAEMIAQTFALGEGVIGQVASEGRARVIDDVRAEDVMMGTTTEFMRNRSMLLVPLKVRDEPLGVMAVLNKQRGSFGHEDQFLLQALADQGALSINYAFLTIEVGKQERIRRELQIARDIQKMLLPDKCPVVKGFDIAAHGSSATEVGGDYYDFFQVDDDRLGIVVADVSGKGVPAALTVAMMRSVFHTQAKGNSDVRDVLSRVNTFMTQDMRRDMFITCIYGILEISTGRFTWARAGHEPLLVAHESGETDVLSPAGFALGIIESPEFDELLDVEVTTLLPGDRVLLFTDGLTEAMNTNGEEFGMERILGILNHDDPIFAEIEHRAHNRLAPSQNGTAANGATNGHADNGKAANGQVKANGKNPVLEDGIDETETANPDQAPCVADPGEDLNDLNWMELAVRSHAGDAPQSDDLTIVYLGAK